MSFHSKSFVTLVTRDRSLLTSLIEVINNSPDFRIHSEYLSLNKTIIEIIIKDPPDLLIIDLDSIASTEQLIDMLEMKNRIRSNKKTYVIIITNVIDPTVINKLMTIDISGYIFKMTCLTEITSSMRAILDHGVALSPQIARVMLETFRISRVSPLSRREAEVLKLLTTGLTYASIADKLSISTSTSKTHLKNIYSKLNVNSKAEVIRKAKVEGLV